LDTNPIFCGSPTTPLKFQFTKKNTGAEMIVSAVLNAIWSLTISLFTPTKNESRSPLEKQDTTTFNESVEPDAMTYSNNNEARKAYMKLLRSNSDYRLIPLPYDMFLKSQADEALVIEPKEKEESEEEIQIAKQRRKILLEMSEEELKQHVISRYQKKGEQ
jgi:hypothetical protein